MDTAEQVRDELKKYSWPSDKNDELTALCEAVDLMDFDKCEEIADSICAQK